MGNVRIVIGMMGMDQHEVGAIAVSRILMEAGMEVIYLGIRQTTDDIIAAIEQEDADAIGLSMHNAGHLTLAPALLAALEKAGLTTPVIIGGIIPDQDVAQLTTDGVAAVLGPGAPAEEVVAAVRQAVNQ